MSNPFIQGDSDLPYIALTRNRNGYIMISTTQSEVVNYADLSLDLMAAAKAWSAILEKNGAPRVYWIMLSEETQHLHMHLFPRWPEDTQKGIPLFESRNSTPQPAWMPALEAALAEWAKTWQVLVRPA
jgi:diadenosine tetraphosphate (Ap4A) HIT family hydrolase